MNNQNIHPSPLSNISNQTKPGDILKRFVAIFIDNCIVQFALSIIIYPIMLLFGASLLSYSPNPSEEEIMGLVAIIFLVALPLSFIGITLYYGWFYKNKGATPGKLIFNLKVINYETGENIGYGKTLLRETIGRMISGILLIGYIIGIARDDKRALHDLIAGTQVVEKQN